MDENKTGDEIRAKRAKLKKEYGELFHAVSEILFRHDPIYINFETNTDEYEPEVGTILPKLKGCHSLDGTLTVIYEEFKKWFGDEAGEKEDYQAIAKEIWILWQNRKMI